MEHIAHADVSLCTAAGSLLVMYADGISEAFSAGLRVIFKTRKLMDGRSGRFLLLNLQPQVRKVFEIIKALDGMNVFKDQEEMDDYLTAMQNKVLNGE